jgi:hypothetical protein
MRKGSQSEKGRRNVKVKRDLMEKAVQSVAHSFLHMRVTAKSLNLHDGEGIAGGGSFDGTILRKQFCQRGIKTQVIYVKIVEISAFLNFF